jgi:hypothetical protein
MPAYRAINFGLVGVISRGIRQLIRRNGMANSIATTPLTIRLDVRKTKKKLLEVLGGISADPDSETFAGDPASCESQPSIGVALRLHQRFRECVDPIQGGGDRMSCLCCIF